MQQPELNNSEALRGDNIAALLHHLGELQPGDSRRLITQLGQTPSVEEVLSSIEEYRRSEVVDAAFEAMAQFWDGYLAKLQVNSLDENMNRMLNIHNPRQCYIPNLVWSAIAG